MANTKTSTRIAAANRSIDFAIDKRKKKSTLICCHEVCVSFVRAVAFEYLSIPLMFSGVISLENWNFSSCLIFKGEKKKKKDIVDESSSGAETECGSSNFRSLLDFRFLLDFAVAAPSSSSNGTLQVLFGWASQENWDWSSKESLTLSHTLKLDWII